MKALLSRLCREEEGQDLTEYALLMVLNALSSIAGMKGLARAISNVYGNAASNLSVDADTVAELRAPATSWREIAARLGVDVAQRASRC